MTGLPMRIVVACAVALLAALAWIGPARAAADDGPCLDCHRQFAGITVGKDKRPLGCAACHAGLDGRSLPHAQTGPVAHGLSAPGARSCLACHDKPAYATLRHGSLGAGCDGCHTVHAPRHGQVRDADTAALCYACHDRKGFAAQVTHPPVAKGDCTDCHELHASEHAGLLTGAPGEDCLGCHRRVKKGRHGAGGILNVGHPLGGEKPGLPDPLRPGQPFQCTSCHDAHRSAHRGLLRTRPTMMFCQQCHPM